MGSAESHGDSPVSFETTLTSYRVSYPRRRSAVTLPLRVDGVKFDLVRSDKDVLAFIVANAPMGCAEFKDGDSGWAVIRGDGVVTAVAAFSGWQPAFSSVEFSGIALRSHAVSTGIVAQLGDYAFRQLLVNRVWARTSSKNARAIKLLEHIGFTPEGTSADFYGVGLGARNYRMLKREWEAQHVSLRVAA